LSDRISALLFLYIGECKDNRQAYPLSMKN